MIWMQRKKGVHRENPQKNQMYSRTTYTALTPEPQTACSSSWTCRSDNSETTNHTFFEWPWLAYHKVPRLVQSLHAISIIYNHGFLYKIFPGSKWTYWPKLFLQLFRTKCLMFVYCLNLSVNIQRDVCEELIVSESKPFLVLLLQSPSRKQLCKLLMRHKIWKSQILYVH